MDAKRTAGLLKTLALDAVPIPVTILTGFLGSGKTTVLNSLLRDPAFADTAVIVNEFGEIGIDHILIEESSEDVLLLDNGCLCCSLRNDLVATLQSLLERRERGEVPEFARVVVETTGLADPAPVIQTFLSDPMRLSQYTLASIVTCYDSAVGHVSTGKFPEVERQLVLADCVVITKGDIGDTEVAKREITRFNADARIVAATGGNVSPETILSVDRTDPKSVQEITHPHARLRSVAVTGRRPLAWDHVNRSVAETMERHGDKIIRLKGLLWVEDGEGPVVVDGVQHLFHRPRRLKSWPEASPKPFLVAITERLSHDETMQYLQAILDP